MDKELAMSELMLVWEICIAVSMQDPLFWILPPSNV